MNFIETRVNISQIKSIIEAVQHLQDAGKDKEVKDILKNLGKELSKIK